MRITICTLIHNLLFFLFLHIWVAWDHISWDNTWKWWWVRNRSEHLRFYIPIFQSPTHPGVPCRNLAAVGQMLLASVPADFCHGGKRRQNNPKGKKKSKGVLSILKVTTLISFGTIPPAPYFFKVSFRMQRGFPLLIKNVQHFEILCTLKVTCNSKRTQSGVLLIRFNISYYGNVESI